MTEVNIASQFFTLDQLPDQQEYRREALRRFEEKGFPGILEEDWRFTNLKPHLKPFSGAKLLSGTDSIGQTNPGIPGLDAWIVNVYPDGPDLKSLGTIPGVSIEPYSFDLSEEKMLALNLETRALYQLNKAMNSGGFSLRIHRNKLIEKPIHINYYYNNSDFSFHFPRHRIVCEEGSAAVLIESYHFLDAQAQLFEISNTKIELEARASLRHGIIQQGIPGFRQANQIIVHQEDDSTYSNFTFNLPESALIRNNLDIYTYGKATHTDMYGLYFPIDEQVVDNHTALHHYLPGCTSNELYKGVLRGRSRAVFNGKVFVHHDAQKTNAFQQNNNIILDDRAIVYAKPQLEIFADDVRCSHGCTVGRFDNDAMFYLRSRGIGEDMARNMLIEAFAFDITSKIQIDAVRDYLNDIIRQKVLPSQVIYN